MSKLTRATVPMCPYCGVRVEMQAVPFHEPPCAYCAACDNYAIPDWGYYDNSKEVAREIRRSAKVCEDNGLDFVAIRLREQADRLDPASDDAEPQEDE